MWCWGMRSAFPACRSTVTCCGCRTASASPRGTIPWPSRRSCASVCRRRSGRSRPTSRSCTGAGSAARNRSARSARCATTAITIVRCMTRDAFEQLVAEALKLIPRRFQREMKNLALVVELEPTAELLAEMEIEPPDSLYGLYQGTPLPERTWGYGNALPDRITIFQRPIEEDCEDEDEIRAVIGETLIHEVGHYFGLSEEEIEEIEEKYWRGETLGPDEDDDEEDEDRP